MEEYDVNHEDVTTFVMTQRILNTRRFFSGLEVKTLSFLEKRQRLHIANTVLDSAQKCSGKSNPATEISR